MSEQVRADRCETCRFWQKYQYGENEGSCRIRSTPKSFPTRYTGEWCGEHEPADSWKVNDLEYEVAIDPLSYVSLGGDFKTAHDAIVKDAFDKAREAQQQKKDDMQRNPSVDVEQLEFFRMDKEKRVAFLKSHGFDTTRPVKVNDAGGGVCRITQRQDCEGEAFFAYLPHTDEIPQWRKRPTLPGIYVCWPGQAKSPEATWALYLGKEDLERGAPFHTEWCYGPIEKPVDQPQDHPSRKK